MALNIGEAQAAIDLVRYLVAGSDSVDHDRALKAAVLLVTKAHATLYAGPTAADVEQWWPDNAVLALEEWFGTEERDTTLEDALAYLRANGIETAQFNDQGKAALG
jgi:hypothetical protein